MIKPLNLDNPEDMKIALCRLVDLAHDERPPRLTAKELMARLTFSRGNWRRGHSRCLIILYNKIRRFRDRGVYK